MSWRWNINPCWHSVDDTSVFSFWCFLHKFGGNSVVNFDSIIGPFAGFLISDFKIHREKRIFIGTENIFLHFYRPIEI